MKTGDGSCCYIAADMKIEATDRVQGSLRRNENPDIKVEFNSGASTEVMSYASTNNRIVEEDRAIHNWYRFVLSYPPHLVRKYLLQFGLSSDGVILDPFCGTGTTLVESKLNGIRSIGLEANPFPCFASRVKLNWNIDGSEMMTAARTVSDSVSKELENQGFHEMPSLEINGSVSALRTLHPDAFRLLLRDSISPVPLHKTLVLLDEIDTLQDAPWYDHLRLALANALVNQISNLKFGPEVGVGKKKHDAPVVSSWMREVNKIAEDLKTACEWKHVKSEVHFADARNITSVIAPHSVDAVITSPPYPNEKDYTRTTRLESVLLGFINNKHDLRSLKKSLLRSNTRGVYKGDDDDHWISENMRITKLAESIERRRIDMGKTSGFERLYARVTKLYFGGMARHFNDLKNVLKPGARLAYVVGDQASYLRIMIRTGELLAEIASDLGYEVERIDLFRERFATATGEMLREEVLVRQWPGEGKKR